MTRPRFLTPGLITPPLMGYLYGKCTLQTRRNLNGLDMAHILLFLLEDSFSFITSIRFQGLCVFLVFACQLITCYFFMFLQNTLFRWPTSEEPDSYLRNVCFQSSPSKYVKCLTAVVLNLDLLKLGVEGQLTGIWARPNTHRGLPLQKSQRLYVPWSLLSGFHFKLKQRF